jgi:hypothetical protein
VKKILHAYFRSRKHNTLFIYLFKSEGYINFLIPLIINGGIVYRALKVQEIDTLSKAIEITVKNEKGERRCFKLFFEEFDDELQGAEIARFCSAVTLLSKMPEEFLPDSVAFSAIPTFKE